MFIIERNKIFHILFLAFIISLTGCAGKVPIIASGVSGEEGLPPEEASFAKFNDLPMSATSKMNVEKSLVFGSASEWYGRINLLVDLSAAGVFDFYRYEMPNFGWKEITSIRSDVSLLTYERGDRIANIRITRSQMESEVWITVSPRDSNIGVPK